MKTECKYDTYIEPEKETDMKIGTMKESKYLKKEDCDPAILVTITGITQENMAGDNQPEELKYVMSFQETAKPMVLNWTNIQLTAKATGTEETDEWIGKKIVLFDDPNVSFGGNLTGGIRVRKAQNQTETAPATVPNDDIPF